MKINFVTNESIELPFETLTNINLDNISLHRAILENVDFSYSSLVEAELRGGLYLGANFTNCNLERANLIAGDFRKTKFVSANLKDARANSCYFMNSDFRHSDLTNVQVNGANFSNCLLQGAIFLCVQIEKAILTQAQYDHTTVWPDNFLPEKHGCIKVDGIGTG